MRALVTLAVAVGVSVSVLAQEKQAREGITNFTRVDAVVACGGATSTAALSGLKDDGFKSIVNLRLATEKGADIEVNTAKARDLGLNYFHIPMSGSNPDPKVVDEFLSVVSDTTNQPVYIHCGSANRVGAVWLIKRVIQDGWPVEKATTEARAIGLTNAGLEKFALDYIAAHK